MEQSDFSIDFRKLNVLAKFEPESITNKDTFERGLIEPSNSNLNAPGVLVGEKTEQTDVALLPGN